MKNIVNAPAASDAPWWHVRRSLQTKLFVALAVWPAGLAFPEFRSAFWALFAEPAQALLTSRFVGDLALTLGVALLGGAGAAFLLRKMHPPQRRAPQL